MMTTLAFIIYGTAGMPVAGWAVLACLALDGLFCWWLSIRRHM